jgi:putative thioredoxin
LTVDVDDFEAQVIDASRAGPVLVDFWAPWCGPCRQLGPILEKIAAEERPGFTLAKVNTDLNPEVSRRYRISSIPAVKLFVDGEVADEFIGALPEPQVRRWLEAAIPSPTREQLAEARQALDEGDTERAAAILETVLNEHPEAEAKALLAHALAFRDPERAATLAKQAAAANANYVDLSQALALIAGLAARSGSVDGSAEPAAVAFEAALTALAQSDIDQALAAFVESVRLNRSFEDQAARRAAVAIFKVLGEKDPLTRKHRRSLEMVLF